MAKKKLPTLDKYVKKMKPPKYCPICGVSRIDFVLHKTDKYITFPFWDLKCIACGFEGELEPDVPIGVTS